MEMKTFESGTNTITVDNTGKVLKMNNRTMFWLRFFAVCDVLLCEKFELTTWNKSGRQTSKTTFWKSEIDNMHAPIK